MTVLSSWGGLLFPNPSAPKSGFYLNSALLSPRSFVFQHASFASATTVNVGTEAQGEGGGLPWRSGRGRPGLFVHRVVCVFAANRSLSSRQSRSPPRNSFSGPPWQLIIEVEAPGARRRRARPCMCAPWCARVRAHVAVGSRGPSEQARSGGRGMNGGMKEGASPALASPVRNPPFQPSLGSSLACAERGCSAGELRSLLSPSLGAPL